MSAPTVSVIIPTYNMAGWVKDAVESALAQTFRDYEVIVVDDGSTDDTEDVLAPYRNQIRYMRIAHGGQAVATNTGVTEARGTYLAFLDADDLWMPTKLERQLPSLMADETIGFSCTDFSVRSPTGTVMPSFFDSGQGFANGHVFDELFDHCWVANPTVIIPRRVIDAVGLFDPALDVGQDFHLWLRIAHTWKVVAVPEVLCAVRQRPDGARPFERAYRSAIRTRERLLLALPDLSPRRRRAVRHQIAELEFRVGQYRLLDGRAREARADARRALSWNWRYGRAALLLALSYGPAPVARSLLSAWGRYRTDSKPRTDA
jgi:glycosyltransferase involved in cell wall biosynthesis